MSKLVNIISHLMAAETYGKEIYSTLIGACVVNNIDIGTEETTVTLVQTSKNRVLVCDEFGRPCGNTDAECCVFPSKNNRDWSTFDTAPHFDIGELKPFDQVLVRDMNVPFYQKTWEQNFYHKYNSDERMHECLFGRFKECVPYNDETKHLLDTTDEAPDFYRTWKSDNEDSK